MKRGGGWGIGGDRSLVAGQLSGTQRQTHLVLDTDRDRQGRAARAQLLCGTGFLVLFALRACVAAAPAALAARTRRAASAAPIGRARGPGLLWGLFVSVVHRGGVCCT
jgi:hypothetical protein